MSTDEPAPTYDTWFTPALIDAVEDFGIDPPAPDYEPDNLGTGNRTAQQWAQAADELRRAALDTEEPT